MAFIYQVDAFTDKPFQGNPAAVCILTAPKEDQWLQNVAMEMNLSETAFLFPEENGYQIRWFTPTTEVDLCGHATLASAHILWEQNLSDQHEISFFSKSGLLKARQNGGRIELDFPAEPETECEAPPTLLEGIGTGVRYVGKNRFDYLIEVENEEIVRDLKPNFDVLAKVETRGVIVTSRSESSAYDFISRAFFPRIGILEDPVTGSAHCCLGPYWQKKLNQSHLAAYQASKRGGALDVRMNGERVFLGGEAVTVLKGEILSE
ncbi:phenazine biosynthesis protein PhzF family [Seinonella peptonophila]|uniref:Phenazine biosynthesis protein PhzF family n=1 Tax=Seinonella peptonophila TaxID=112248 RepID=A0A1M4SM55_9BACL|nr:PhzF family phenazine biosynthesis protein [Seinonella peptonophila]SHE33238.1 phenazine biosynthesis protein PhzF family [Seinonella peptonophila]